MTQVSLRRNRPPVLSQESLQHLWRGLNHRYFENLLPPISIVWSQRLTSSIGMFASRGGPRSLNRLASAPDRREIRLSYPLLERLAERTPYAQQELLNTLAHEMIHQWQFDVLKRRPDHGPDFLRKAVAMNRSGEVAVTTYHSLQKEVLELSRFAWRCKNCGLIFHRQRRTIEPRRHRCGNCHGTLQELHKSHGAFLSTPSGDGGPACREVLDGRTGQLSLEFSGSEARNVLVPPSILFPRTGPDA